MLDVRCVTTSAFAPSFAARFRASFVAATSLSAALAPFAPVPSTVPTAWQRGADSGGMVRTRAPPSVSWTVQAAQVIATSAAAILVVR